jgi:hypothetical protein
MEIKKSLHYPHRQGAKVVVEVLEVKEGDKPEAVVLEVMETHRRGESNYNHNHPNWNRICKPELTGYGSC